MRYETILRLPERDQRFARDAHGVLYVYDHSGHDPSETEDGPLRVLVDEPLDVDVKVTSITVIEERRGTRGRCCMLTRNLVELLVAVPELRCELDAETRKLLAALKAAEGTEK